MAATTSARAASPLRYSVKTGQTKTKISKTFIITTLFVVLMLGRTNKPTQLICNCYFDLFRCEILPENIDSECELLPDPADSCCKV